MRNGSGRQIRVTYNALGKAASEKVYASPSSYTALSTKTYTYAKTGALASVTEDGASISYTYDGAGRVLTETNSDGTVRTYTYDSMGRRATFTLTKNNTAVTAAAYAEDFLSGLNAGGLADSRSVAQYVESAEKKNAQYAGTPLETVNYERNGIVTYTYEEVKRSKSYSEVTNLVGNAVLTLMIIGLIAASGGALAPELVPYLP